MQHQNLAHDPNHRSHDHTLIAGHAAGDLPDSEAVRAQALVAACADCADLHRDLVAIAAATRALPTLATAPRDFRLQPAQAERLRRGSWLRTILSPFGAARSATRPMAAAFTSLGIAGLLIGTVLPGLLGNPTASSVERDQALGAAGAPTGAPVAPEGAAGAPRASLDLGIKDGEFGAYQGSAQPTDHAVVNAAGDNSSGGDGDGDSAERLSFSSPPNMIVIGSLALLAIGLALFGLRLAGRRLR